MTPTRCLCDLEQTFNLSKGGYFSCDTDLNRLSGRSYALRRYILACLQSGARCFEASIARQFGRGCMEEIYGMLFLLLDYDSAQ